MLNDRGKNNRIIGGDEILSKADITITGDDNEIVFGPNFQFRKITMQIKSNRTKTIFGEGCNFIGALTLIHNSHDASIIIGDKMQVNGSLWMSCAGPGRSITFGNDCLIASARLRTSDHHKIFTLHGDKPINPPGNIKVGDHVWLGEDVLLLKGADVGSGSVIGAKSLVTKAVPQNVLAAGNPLRVIKEEIRWEY